LRKNTEEDIDVYEKYYKELIQLEKKKWNKLCSFKN
jgi:hypothetical protein